MENIFISTKIISALFLLVIAPGILCLSQCRRRVSALDSYEMISCSLVCGLATWIPISAIAYSFHVSSNAPIYMSLFSTGALTVWLVLKNKVSFSTLASLNIKKYFSDFSNIYIVVIIFQSILIGYTAQFQAANADALAHLAAMRNLATAETVMSCDWILGEGSPILAAYGCNPWYLAAGMIVKFSHVDAALAYSTMAGAIYFLSVLSMYALMKAISGDAVISKIGSLIFTVVSLLSWLQENGNGTYNVSSNWIIFPQAMVDYVLFPITLAIFIRYILQRSEVFFVLTIISLVVITRFHPNWLVWAPLIISGIIIFRNCCVGRFQIKKRINYKRIFFVASVLFLSALSFLFCKNTFMTDQNLMPSIDLWRENGESLLYFSSYIFLYDPVWDMKSRGLFDLATIALFWYLHKNHKENYNELLVIYLGILIVISFVVFDPIIVFFMIKATGSSIPLSRSFSLVWPSLSAFTIYAVLALFKVRYKKTPFMAVTIALMTVNGTLLFAYQYVPFLQAVYENHGHYYSTSTSPSMEPFSTLSTLEHGKIAVRTPLATPIAAFTNLDPITMDKFRSKSLVDWGINEYDNDSLLTFNKSYQELLSIIHKRNIRYIMIDRSDIYAINNFKKYPTLIQWKASAGVDEIWEIQQSHD